MKFFYLTKEALKALIKKILESLRTLGGSETSLASRNKYYNIITIFKKIFSLFVFWSGDKGSSNFVQSKNSFKT